MASRTSHSQQQRPGGAESAPRAVIDENLVAEVAALLCYWIGDTRWKAMSEAMDRDALRKAFPSAEGFEARVVGEILGAYGSSTEPSAPTTVTLLTPGELVEVVAMATTVALCARKYETNNKITRHFSVVDGILEHYLKGEWGPGLLPALKKLSLDDESPNTAAARSMAALIGVEARPPNLSLRAPFLRTEHDRSAIMQFWRKASSNYFKYCELTTRNQEDLVNEHFGTFAKEAIAVFKAHTTLSESGSHLLHFSDIQRRMLDFIKHTNSLFGNLVEFDQRYGIAKMARFLSEATPGSFIFGKDTQNAFIPPEMFTEFGVSPESLFRLHRILAGARVEPSSRFRYNAAPFEVSMPTAEAVELLEVAKKTFDGRHNELTSAFLDGLSLAGKRRKDNVIFFSGFCLSKKEGVFTIGYSGAYLRPEDFRSLRGITNFLMQKDWGPKGSPKFESGYYLSFEKWNGLKRALVLATNIPLVEIRAALRGLRTEQLLWQTRDSGELAAPRRDELSFLNPRGYISNALTAPLFEAEPLLWNRYGCSFELETLAGEGPSIPRVENHDIRTTASRRELTALNRIDSPKFFDIGLRFLEGMSHDGSSEALLRRFASAAPGGWMQGIQELGEFSSRFLAELPAAQSEPTDGSKRGVYLQLGERFAKHFFYRGVPTTAFFSMASEFALEISKKPHLEGFRNEWLATSGEVLAGHVPQLISSIPRDTFKQFLVDPELRELLTSSVRDLNLWDSGRLLQPFLDLWSDGVIPLSGGGRKLIRDFIERFEKAGFEVGSCDPKVAMQSLILAVRDKKLLGTVDAIEAGTALTRSAGGNTDKVKTLLGRLASEIVASGAPTNPKQLLNFLLGIPPDQLDDLPIEKMALSFRLQLETPPSRETLVSTLRDVLNREGVSRQFCRIVLKACPEEVKAEVLGNLRSVKVAAVVSGMTNAADLKGQAGEVGRAESIRRLYFKEQSAAIGQGARSSFENYYSGTKTINAFVTLGVPPGATDGEVLASFRALGKAFHSDMLSPGEAKIGDRMFKELKEAYDAIATVEGRKVYCQMLTAECSLSADKIAAFSPKTLWFKDHLKDLEIEVKDIEVERKPSQPSAPQAGPRILTLGDGAATQK